MSLDVLIGHRDSCPDDGVQSTQVASIPRAGDAEQGFPPGEEVFHEYPVAEQDSVLRFVLRGQIPSPAAFVRQH
jgi:hypothetical protein